MCRNKYQLGAEVTHVLCSTAPCAATDIKLELTAATAEPLDCFAWLSTGADR